MFSPSRQDAEKRMEFDLVKQSSRLGDEIEELSERQAKVAKYIKDHAEEEGDKPKKVSVDSLGNPPDKLTAQLLRLIADNKALEDCMYVLDKALAQDVVELPDYLKTTRRLATAQFNNRALVRSCPSRSSMCSD